MRKAGWSGGFGNPGSHGEGDLPSFCDDGSQVLFGNHDATWLGNDRISLFDNGWQRPQANRSRAVVVDIASGSAVWEYAANSLNSFYSAYQGSAQHLPNGNVLDHLHGHGAYFRGDAGRSAWCGNT